MTATLLATIAAASVSGFLFVVTYAVASSRMSRWNYLAHLITGATVRAAVITVAALGMALAVLWAPFILHLLVFDGIKGWYVIPMFAGVALGQLASRRITN